MNILPFTKNTHNVTTSLFLFVQFLQSLLMVSLNGARGLNVQGPAVLIYCACVNDRVSNRTFRAALVPLQK